MLIRCGFDIAFDCPAPTPLILMLSLRPERAADLVSSEEIKAVSPEGQVKLRPYRDIFGNVCHRLTAPAGRIDLRADFLVRDSGQPDEVASRATQHPVDELPDEALLYL